MASFHYLALVVWCSFECVLVTSILLGWAQLLEVLENERYLSSYCDKAFTNLPSNSTSSEQRTTTCNTQDGLLNLVYSFASFSTSISMFLGGKFLDMYGFRKTRLLSCLIYFAAGVLMYLSTLGVHELIFPGIILTCVGGSFFMTCLVKVCGLIPRRRCTVVGIINASIDLSSIMLLVCKFTYRAGLPFKNIVLVYYVFAVIHGLIFTYTLFPNPSASSKREVVTLEKKQKQFSMTEDAEAKKTEIAYNSSFPVLRNGYSSEMYHELSATVVENNAHESDEDNPRTSDYSLSEGSEVFPGESMPEIDLRWQTLEKYQSISSNELVCCQLDGCSVTSNCTLGPQDEVIKNELQTNDESNMRRKLCRCSDDYSLHEINNLSCSADTQQRRRRHSSIICIENTNLDKEVDCKIDDSLLCCDAGSNDTTKETEKPSPHCEIRLKSSDIEVQCRANQYSEVHLSLPELRNTKTNKLNRETSLETRLQNTLTETGRHVVDESAGMSDEELLQDNDASIIVHLSALDATNTQQESSMKKATAVYDGDPGTTLWQHIKTPQHILHTAFISVGLLRILTFVGMLNLNLKRLTSDQDQVDLYLTVFAFIVVLEILLCVVPGTLLDWKPKGKHADYSLVLSLIITNCLGILLTAGILVPSLKVQMVCFVLYALNRLFFYCSHGAFIINRFPSLHTGALFGFSLLVASLFSLLQFPLFIFVEGPCNGDPTLMNLVFLVLQVLMFAHPVYLHRTSSNKKSRLPQQNV